ncbi:hypothetical protein CUMW_270450 [Citrus unshiu]|uniref:Carbohydrate kinase PfkB domain-containing protein n=1 Tax=Citrus unshiu TaxID=55188 RepID=A0A2H5QXA6_CITUN|nr:hypothetical protein CUMW_270450 [Citrus unshiu]
MTSNVLLVMAGESRWKIVNNGGGFAAVLLTSRQLQKQEAAELVIIGGMVLDIHATPSIPVNPRTTTPGKVNYVLGCVARNVTECMSKLGAKPYMISALGLDMAGYVAGIRVLLEDWIAAGSFTASLVVGILELIFGSFVK